MVFNPFNPQNREITLNEVQCILSQYGLPTTQINNLELYKRAFVHRSYTKRPQWENEMQKKQYEMSIVVKRLHNTIPATFTLIECVPMRRTFLVDIVSIPPIVHFGRIA